MKTDTRSASSCALPVKNPRFDSEDTFCSTSAQTALPLAEMTSDGENDDSNEDASVLRRNDDLSCLAAMSTSAWHSDNLLQRRDNRRRHKEFDGQERRVEKTERQVVSAKEGWMAEQDARRWNDKYLFIGEKRLIHRSRIKCFTLTLIRSEED